MSGLSETALASISSTRAAWRRLSRHAPMTCGWQRIEYGSWTRGQLACEARMALPCTSSRMTRATSIWPSVTADGVDARIERLERSLDRFQGQGAGDERRAEHVLRAEQPGEAQRRGHLRAVEQRQPFLGPERERFDSGARQTVLVRACVCRRCGPRRRRSAQPPGAREARDRRRLRPILWRECTDTRAH